jgi:hypothetical protein
MFRELVGTVLGATVEPFTGRAELWRRHNRRIQSLLSVSDAIDAVKSRWGVDAALDRERPIFVFSAGWRSGSTLLQRLLMSGGNALIWGEPYTASDIVGRLAESLRIFSANYPPQNFFVQSEEASPGGNLHRKWIAHLYPPPQDLRDAHRAFLTTLLATPAARLGFERWGFKDCKYGIEHAAYLKWLFPNAKFFFIYRNPYDAYRSFRLFGAYLQWPDNTVFTAREFGRLWKSLMEGFLAGHSGVDGTLVKFEDLVSGRFGVHELETLAGVTCNRSILTEKIAGRGERVLAPLPRLEEQILAMSVGELASTLGYEAGERDRESS